MTKKDDKYKALESEYQDFAYIVCHDLSAPLRQIQSFLDMLLQAADHPLNETQKTYKDMLDTIGLQTTEKIQALQKFSDVSTERMNLEAVDLNHCVKKAKGRLQSEIQQAEADIQLADLPIIQADSAMMNDVMFNLLDNAVKFQKPDVRPVIKISASIEDTVTLSIQDNGIGLSEISYEDALKIFRFHHKNANTKGSGVGLALVKKILRTHGADMELFSSHENGLTVTIKNLQQA